jgi:hypothetical protein
LPLCVSRRNDCDLKGLSPPGVLAPGSVAKANQPTIALLLNTENHPLRICRIDHRCHRMRVAATIPKSMKTRMADKNQPVVSTDIAASHSYWFCSWF